MVKWCGTALILTLLATGCTPTAAIESTAAPTSEATSRPAPASVSAEPDIEASAVPLIACTAALTPAQTEGPYYAPGSPERSSLAEAGIPGSPLLITGVVMDADCQPIGGAQIDFWQADGAGEYDNVGYRLRGHQLTGPDGGYVLETVVPGVYPGRAPHIHVKILTPDGRELLTTQLYLRGVSDQIPDGFFDAALLADDEAPGPDGRRHVSFDFVVDP
jgi:protocatechuate 3,4-dioxygenase beta subunit